MCQKQVRDQILSFATTIISGNLSFLPILIGVAKKSLMTHFFPLSLHWLILYFRPHDWSTSRRSEQFELTPSMFSFLSSTIAIYSRLSWGKEEEEWHFHRIKRWFSSHSSVFFAPSSPRRSSSSLPSSTRDDEDDFFLVACCSMKKINASCYEGWNVCVKCVHRHFADSVGRRAKKEKENESMEELIMFWV